MQDMVSAALQYLNSGNSPLPGPPPAQAPSQAENLPSPPAYLHAAGNISGTSSLLQAEALPERTRGVTLPLCGDFSQVQQLTGALRHLSACTYPLTRMEACGAGVWQTCTCSECKIKKLPEPGSAPVFSCDCKDGTGLKLVCMAKASVEALLDVGTGKWVDHPDPEYMGEYQMTADCPAWAQDYDCRKPNSPAPVNPDFIKTQYRCVHLESSFTASDGMSCPLTVSLRCINTALFLDF
jgi:hypothetical protein